MSVTNFPKYLKTLHFEFIAAIVIIVAVPTLYLILQNEEVETDSLNYPLKSIVLPSPENLSDRIFNIASGRDSVLMCANITADNQSHIVEIYDNNKLKSKFKLGSTSRIDCIQPLDINGDGSDEIFHPVSYPGLPYLNQNDNLDGILLCATDLNGHTSIFDRVTPEDFYVGMDNSICSTWTAAARVIYNTDNITPVVHKNYFLAGLYGRINHVKSRYIYLYSRSNPVNRIAEIAVEFYPTFGIAHLLADGSEVFTVCGSAYKYGQYDFYSLETQSNVDPTDFIDTNRAGIVQFDIHGNVRWKMLFDKKIGEIGLSGGEIASQPLTVYFHEDIIMAKGGHESVTVLQIDPESGTVVQTEHFPGSVMRLTGRSVAGCGYGAILRLPNHQARLLHKDGRISKLFTFYNDGSSGACPLVSYRSEFFFISPYKDAINLLYGLNGKILGIMNGKFHHTSLEYPPYGQAVPFQSNSGYALAGVVANNPFWWLWKIRWFIGIACIPVIMLGMGYWRYRQGEVSHSDLMKRYEELEDTIAQRTRELSDANELLAKEINLRQRAEHDLRNQNERLENIFNSVSDGIIGLDPNHTIKQANQAFYELTGVDPSATLPSPVTEVLQFADNASATVFQSAFEKNGFVTTPVRLYGTDSNIKYVRINVRRLDTSQSDIRFLIVFRDVTHLYAASAEEPDTQNFPAIIGRSVKIKQVLRLVEEIADNLTPVLITGESGTGKELIAKAIHYNGSRGSGVFIPVNCAALTENLLESELFGHKKGSFTGAIQDRKGLFESARNGTLFLDEIGEIPNVTQAKLLRVLQDGEFTRLGESVPIHTNARIVCATNKYLPDMIKDGRFREDLYYRLNVFAINVPPLRERSEDILPLAEYFIKDFNGSLNRQVQAISDEAMEQLLSYHWLGNIRELRNTINGAMILCHGNTLEPRHFNPEFFQSERQPVEVRYSVISTRPVVSRSAIEDSETGFVESLKRNNWNITKVARELDISRTAVYKRLKSMNIKIPR